MNSEELRNYVTLLNDQDAKPWDREEAAEILGKSGHQGIANALNALIDALRDDNDVIRKAAARALGDLRNPTSIETLMSTMEDNDSMSHNLEGTFLAIDKTGTSRWNARRDVRPGVGTPGARCAPASVEEPTTVVAAR